MNPKFRAPLKATILAKANTIRSTTPISAACCVTIGIWVVPKPIVTGKITASRPKSNPPKVPRTIGVAFRGATTRLRVLVKDHKEQCHGYSKDSQ